MTAAPQIKLPMQALIDASLDMIRLRGDVTDAIVILANEKTGEAKVSTLRGDSNHALQVLEKTVYAVKKARAGSRGIILPS